MVFAAGLLLSDIAYLIDPNFLLLPSFFGLTFLPFLIINLIAFIFWIFTKFRNTWLSALVLLLSIPNISKHVAFGNPEYTASQELKVLSYNVRLFDLYNWSSNKKTRNKILDFIADEKADIICLQEFFNTNDPKYFNTLDTLLTVQPAVNVHEEYTAVLHGGLNKFGIATLSKYPIINQQRIPLDTSGHNIAIFSDVKCPKGMVRVFNLHLASVHLSGMQKSIEQHIEDNDQNQQWNDLKIMTAKLAGGFKKRANQSNVIRSYIEDSPFPVIVCGDFNDTPSSYSYAQLSLGLKDAFIEGGSGIGTTYLGFLPALRIDYMLYSDGVSLADFDISSTELSDHKPIIGRFNFE